MTAALLSGPQQKNLNEGEYKCDHSIYGALGGNTVVEMKHAEVLLMLSFTYVLVFWYVMDEINDKGSCTSRK